MRCLDLQSVVLVSGCVVQQCPEVLTFFKQALETVDSAKREMSQQKEMRNSHVQSYTLSLLVPTLTVLFSHVGFRGVSRLLLVGPVLVHCRVLFQSLLEMATGVTPIFVGT